MAEGYGILNIGVGQKCIMHCGKSQFLNDTLFPNATHTPFNTADNSAFSSGQVDVFFGKAFERKLNTVFMDGTGELSPETIKHCLCLTNMLIIHFAKEDLNDPAQYEKLEEAIGLA